MRLKWGSMFNNWSVVLKYAIILELIIKWYSYCFVAYYVFAEQQEHNKKQNNYIIL
jgi:hypothetical protein